MRCSPRLALAVACAAATTPAVVAQRACNGSPSLCDRPYSNVTFVGSHDSVFVGPLPTQNQYNSLADQMSMGIRFLQAQTHAKNGGIEMCHTSCDLEDAGSLADFLSPVKSFLDANPNEVLTLLLTNGDAIPVSQFGDAFKAAGLDGLAFAPSGVLPMASWPSLGSLIDQGKRLVVFMDYHADTSSVPYILDEFAYFFETPFDTTKDNFNQCNLDRPGGASPDGRMYIVNHFLDVDIFGITIPDPVHAPETNSVDSITSKANLCISKYGRQPGFFLLDFVALGDPIGAQKKLNNI